MAEQESARPRLGPPPGAEQDEYHALCGLAVAGLVLGLFSVVALVDPRAAVVSAAGILVSGLALWRIARRSPELVGRKAAVIGLVLSLLFGSVAVGHSLAYRWLLIRQAQQVGMTWFNLIAQGQPQAAHQLVFAPQDREPADGDLWAFYCTNEPRYRALEKYLATPLLRTLLALGTRATVRPYATEEIDTRAGEEYVVGLYSVTFDQDGRKTTFLVRLVAQHLGNDAAGRSAWKIVGSEGGVHPEWEKDPARR